MPLLRWWVSVAILLITYSTVINGWRNTLKYVIKNEFTQVPLSYKVEGEMYNAWQFRNHSNMQLVPLVKSGKQPVKIESITRHFLSEQNLTLVLDEDAATADIWSVEAKGRHYLLRNTKATMFLCVQTSPNTSWFMEHAHETRCHWIIRDVNLEERTVAIIVFTTFGAVSILLILSFGLYFALKRCARNEYEEVGDQAKGVTRGFRSAIQYT